MRAFLSPDNVLGWTRGDVLAIAAALLCFIALPGTGGALEWLRNRGRTLAAISPALLTLLLAAIPVALRLALLPRHPVPVPSGADDFGYLLLADTLRHGRLSNPAPDLPVFFEQLFTLTTPVRASIFPLGQGCALAAGWLIAGAPWAGVLLSGALFIGALFWMLRAITGPRWALCGTLLGICQLGPLCYWTNCYWGGFVPALGGCLAFGALARMRTRITWRLCVLLSGGLGLHWLTRQYESVLFLIGGLAFGAAIGWRPMWRKVAPRVALLSLPFLMLIALHNRAVTGRALELPYMLYRYGYGVPATFTWQGNPVPHHVLNREQARDYATESAVHGEGPDDWKRYALRLVERLRFYRFFLYAPLALAFSWAVWRARDRWTVLALFAIGVFVAGTNFYPYFFPHYSAAVACLFLALAVRGLQSMSPRASAALLLACLGQFSLFYAYALTHSALLGDDESWDFLNGGDPEGRAAVARQLDAAGGLQIVFVPETEKADGPSWIGNDADLMHARTLWVHDEGDIRNRELLDRMPERRAYLLHLDGTPPRLTAYRPNASPFEDVR